MGRLVGVVVVGGGFKPLLSLNPSTVLVVVGWGCGYCWAVTIGLFTAQSLLMNVFGINHFSTTKFNKY